jgi:hypothetical protein
MDPSEVKDLDKFWIPSEYAHLDFFRNDSKFSWFRSKQSEHFVVFWEPGFGNDPKNAPALDGMNMAVDIDDLLEKAEQFFTTNIEVLKMAELGANKSFLDKYKMEIFLFYTTEWMAYGSGYDNTIGASLPDRCTAAVDEDIRFECTSSSTRIWSASSSHYKRCDIC